jgi:opacity protein-like surface antigen
MVSVKFLAGAAATAMISTAAMAADLPPPMPPISYQPAVVVEQPSGGWYLRGDVGVGVQTFKNFDHFQTNPAFVWPSTWAINQQDIQDATILGFGIGYAVNSWFRFDVTGEYRTKAKIKVIGSYSGATCNGGVGSCFDVYDGDHSAAVLMANAYIDLGTWWCLTPYIGGGVGGAYNRITGINDVGYIADGTTGFGFASSDSAKWNLAWNVQAGLTYNVSNNFKVDFSWRYLNMGSPQSGIIDCASTGCQTNGSRAYYTLTDMTSQDFRIGLRWMLQPEAAPIVMPQPAPPLMRRG